MSRVVLVLVLSVVAFAVMLNIAPEVVERLLFQAADSPADSSEVASAAIESPRKAVRKRPAPAQESSAAEPMTDAPSATPSNEPASPLPLRTVFSVSAEDAALYSTNAPGGVVISHLRKGDIVEPQFTMNSAGQEWTFVSVADQKVSGFVRSDNLGKKKAAAEPTSR
jgi:hypothetical protein